MKKICQKMYLFLYMLVVFSSNAFSQYNISIHLNFKPSAHAYDTIFIAGNFNNWQPGLKKWRFVKDGDGVSVNINNTLLNPIEFKCTRGNWQKSECAADGIAIQNHIIKLSSDTNINLSIAGWNDDFSDNGKQHTASANVHIIDTAFAMPQLGRTRKIWIYLPADYAATQVRYPVMYMQDGQNIFDDYTAYAGEWNVDETLDDLIKNGTPPCIVVGIDNGPQRMTEYNPYTFEKFGKGEGDQYVDFLTNTLKPFVDNNFRTIPHKDNTIIAGSSMGGLIAYYAMLKYPEVYGNAGVFSPSFWIADKIKNLTDLTGSTFTGKVFFYIGGQEGDVNVHNMQEVADRLSTHSKAIISTNIDLHGQHNEQAWRKWFSTFYQWIMTPSL